MATGGFVDRWKARARETAGPRPRSRAAAVVIVLLWVAALLLSARMLAPLAARGR